MSVWQTMTPDQKASAVRAAAGRGLSQRDAARELGASESTVGRIARSRGIRFAAASGRRADAPLSGPAPRAWRAMNARQKEEAVRAGHGSGLGWPAIAARHDTTSSAVANVGRRIGLSAAARPEAAAPAAQDWAAMNGAGRLAALRDGIAAGRTSTEIARQLGTTRSAVCGAARRAGLHFTAAEIIDLAERRARLPAAAVPPLSPAAPFLPAAGDPEPGSPGETSPEDGADPVPEPVPVDAGRAAPGAGILDLAFGQCRFPLWGKAAPAFGAERFCAAPALPGKAWCGAHQALCTLPPVRRPSADHPVRTGK